MLARGLGLLTRSSARSAHEPQDALDAELLELAIAARGVDGATHTRLKPRHRRAETLHRTLLFADIGGCVAALVFVQTFVVHRFQRSDVLIDTLMLIGLGVWVVLANMYGLYERDRICFGRSTTDDLPALIILTTLATWFGLVWLHALHLARPRFHVAVSFWFAALLCIAAGRVIARMVIQPRLNNRERTLILGAGRVGTMVAKKLARRPEFGLDIVGFADDEPGELPEDAPPLLGGTSRLEQLIRAYDIERVVVAFSRLTDLEQVELSQRCMALGVQVDIVPRMYEVIGSRNYVHDLAGIPLIALRAPNLSRSSRVLKRGLDLVVAGTALIVLSPFFAFAAWRIKSTSPGPVFFRQERMGAGGKRFRMLKFRTMSGDAEERKAQVSHLNKHQEAGPRMFKIPDDPRVTSFGRFLRTWSLDELPQLIHVVKGEMSLVGPRPLVLGEDENIVGQRRRRLHLMPGMTGLWQVLGRSDIPFAEMVKLDYLYVTNWSLWGDITLLARTIPVVLRRQGAY
ncbi:MAG: hypothetical protein C5B48_00945 [Candidatus Rokuibacteriota bacterium]|nr:MAG: hypothetical protein C5B48_00945 [Candidatus Rokubacteria bacterium]